ncbi:hypothetical protein Kpol_513p34 [Vanderwaltozyma polyspora DSM 70294]|uniref:Uncharacterized protein n=1 Tax=Vanderwaltozyma polyspora (strain ATCC 22028 / DSM 70294 / BCRC 21397 / CBS 2163 / NBRC 10782 / NRRL Y-8283 / UCD 57-17) TaxID=436907 RepID=A7TMM0_VANPO|nr:uncharacterized protein Kpol_513p34 [Vanderwaltozyma polyspora DSM 70294]EDO16518.1 hypothetical protein Kpol_513p34 [Vanderwaltozyma polyspora DSM 70294]
MTEPAPSFSKIKTLYDMYYGFRPNKPTFLPEEYPDLTGKTAIVTGCNTGIGYFVMKLLYSKNCNVIAVVRTESKGIEAREKVLEEIKESSGSISVVGGCDLLDMTSIKSAAEKVKQTLGDKPLNIIIHNAGLMSSFNDGVSKQGIEAMFSTNVMGPQLLQHFLDPLFLKKDSDFKRIVWVSSVAHLVGFPQYGINWENPGFINEPLDKRPAYWTLYGQSKAANILQAKAWYTKNQKIADEIGCVSVSCYPGNLKSELSRDFGTISKFVIMSVCWDVIYGAYSELYAALSPDLTTKDQGAYVVPFGEVQDPRNDLKVGLTNGTDLKLFNMVEDMIKDYF